MHCYGIHNNIPIYFAMKSLSPVCMCLHTVLIPTDMRKKKEDKKKTVNQLSFNE